jgi:hypothetical protein
MDHLPDVLPLTFQLGYLRFNRTTTRVRRIVFGEIIAWKSSFDNPEDLSGVAKEEF